ncbi:MAG: DUF1501 domain-containing protein [Planctomycetales bacterium]
MTPPLHCTRRELLSRSAHGFGLVALAHLLGRDVRRAAAATEPPPRWMVHPPRVKHVILLFMDGGPSQVDTFDPKPILNREHGKPFPAKIDATQFDQNGTCLGSPFQFAQHGESGLPISELFPHLSQLADDLCVIRSMQADFAEHSQASFHLHCGHPLQGRPALGSWVCYGLGAEHENLPGYVVLNGGLLPIGGGENFSNAFLPAIHQGTIFDTYSGSELVGNVTPADPPEEQRRLLDFVAGHDAQFLRSQGGRANPETQAIEAAIRNYETAGAMQSAIPDLARFSEETAATQSAYGLDSENPHQRQFARQCLLARRLIERGVPFVELTMMKGIRFVAPWDDHGNISEGHPKMAAAVDQPIAALIRDLKARGLFDSTLLIFAGEFGRTPFAQGTLGRDHNPQGFSIWLAGGGVRGGLAYGATDEFGYRAVEKIVTIHDLHATILYLMGMDHERLTFRWGGRDLRLTDVYGQVLFDCLASGRD